MQNENRGEIRNQRHRQLFGYLVSTHVKPDEYFAKGLQVLRESSRTANEGIYFKGEEIGYDPGIKGEWALRALSSDVRREVEAHGVGSHVPVGTTPEEARRLPLEALMQILTTGELKGGSATLEGSQLSVFTHSPFILLSNRGQRIVEVDANGRQKLSGLRTVLVNDQFEAMCDDLKARFPGVSFRTAEQIDDSVFDRKEPKYKSFEDVVQEQLKKEGLG